MRQRRDRRHLPGRDRGGDHPSAVQNLAPQMDASPLRACAPWTGPPRIRCLPASSAGARTVTAVAFYDDLDAYCLTGGISFASSGFTELWRICRTMALTVVADIHTHPGRWVMQSEIDATNRHDIPLGWAVDSEGHPTRSASAAIEGALLPTGGPKGFGLAFMGSSQMRV
jgi:Malate/L-lactate dehydrogenase